MSTPKRELVPGECYHIYNRSSGAKIIFHGAKDYERFLLKMREYQEKFPVDILAFCLMPNHFHLLIRPVAKQPQGSAGPLGLDLEAQAFLHRLLTAYSKYYDSKHEEHSGHVFQGRYCAKHVKDDGYYHQLCAYIHDNPVRKKLADKPGEWPYSSYFALTAKQTDLRAGSLSKAIHGLLTLAPELSDFDQAKIYRDFARSRDKSAQQVREWLWE